MSEDSGYMFREFPKDPLVSSKMFFVRRADRIVRTQPGWKTEKEEPYADPAGRLFRVTTPRRNFSRNTPPIVLNEEKPPYSICALELFV